MTGQEIRSRAADQVAREKPDATLGEIQTLARSLVNGFEVWLANGDRPSAPSAPKPA